MKFEHNNISPLDSRYADKIVDTRLCFSESQLIRKRFEIEIDWLVYLCSKKPDQFLKISTATRKKLNLLKNNFSDKDVIKIKKLRKKPIMMLRRSNIS